MKLVLIIIHLASGNMTTIPMVHPTVCELARARVLETRTDIIDYDQDRKNVLKEGYWSSDSTAKEVDAICVWTDYKD